MRVCVCVCVCVRVCVCDLCLCGNKSFVIFQNIVSEQCRSKSCMPFEKIRSAHNYIVFSSFYREPQGVLALELYHCVRQSLRLLSSGTKFLETSISMWILVSQTLFTAKGRTTKVSTVGI